MINWYKKTPPKRRRNYYISWFIRYVFFTSAFITIVIGLYYLINHEENPITGRYSVYSLPKELIDEIEEDVLQELVDEYRDSFIPYTDDYVKRLDRIVDKLVKVNHDIEGIGEKIWTPVVVNDDNRCDVIILQESGHIFVFKKMLDLCKSDDQLAYVLAHELSHMILNHKREPVVYSSVLDWPYVTFFPKLWIIGRPEDLTFKFDWMQTIDNWFNTRFKNWAKDVLNRSRYSDELEEEADRIGLQLISRSCYDVRESRNFCTNYKHLSELSDNDINIINNYFAKHPINNNRFEYLNRYMNAFIKIREECGCQPLV